MGMSADWPLAVQLGATYVRVGSAIFGARDSVPLNPELALNCRMRCIAGLIEIPTKCGH